MYGNRTSLARRPWEASRALKSDSKVNGRQERKQRALLAKLLKGRKSNHGRETGVAGAKKGRKEWKKSALLARLFKERKNKHGREAGVADAKKRWKEWKTKGAAGKAV